jgi:hypothetical protein
MSDISLTSALTARLTSLKSNVTSPNKGDKASPDVQNTTSSNEPAAIVMTSLTQKAQDLQKLLDRLESSITTITSARSKVDEVVAGIEEAGGITVRARDLLRTDAGYDGNKDRILELESRFGGVLKKIDQIVESAARGGVNLLKGDTLTTPFDMSGKSMVLTQGLNLTTQGLEFREADFTTAESVQNSRIDVMNALDIAVTLRHLLSSDLILMQTRQEFSNETVKALSDGVAQSPLSNPLTDMTEEAASLMALQLRQQLSNSTVSLAAETQQFLLKQF